MAIDRKLEDYHRKRAEVLTVLDRARPVFNLPYRQAWPALAEFREKLTAAMQELQRYQHASIFDPIIIANGADRLHAESLKSDCVMLAMEYDSFRKRWVKYVVEDYWSDYRLSAIAMMTTIRSRIANQDNIIRGLRFP